MDQKPDNSRPGGKKKSGAARRQRRRAAGERTTAPRTGSAGQPGFKDLATETRVRAAAIESLVAADTTGQFIDEVLAPRLRELEERDRHLLQEVTYGAVRHRNTLDHLLNTHLRLAMAKQRAPLRWGLRVAAYQLIYLDRVPPHAAVHQTLEALKGFADMAPRDIGFANAVLRKIAGEVRKKTAEPPDDANDPTAIPIRSGWCHFNRPVLPLYLLDPPAHIGLKHSHPHWLVSRWIARHGEEEARFLCAAQNRIPPLTARVTRLAPSRDALLEALRAEGMEVEPGGLEDSVLIRRSGDLARSQALARGWFQVQDETAIRIGEALAPPRGARVLDLCAAPGGKAAQFLERAGEEGHVVAADRSEEKLALVRENLSRLGTNFTTVAIPEDPGAVDLGERFTHVLLDAPCSNTGVLARRPEARWRVHREDLAALADLQTKLFACALRHLAPGGRFLYATCSIESEENEGVVARAFAAHPGLVEVETALFLPHRTAGDGGFYSLLIGPR